MNGGNWVDYVRVPAATRATHYRLFDPNPLPRMALIPTGSFAMGDSLSDGFSHELPVHESYVSAFYMDTTLVSYALWTNVYSWATSRGYSFNNGGAGKAADHPMHTVSWYDAVKWCNARSQQTGATPVYYTDAGLTQVYASGDTDAVYPDWTAKGFRLPTEAEWEKAARGGLSGQRFPWGSTISWDHANYYAHPEYYDWDVSPAQDYDPAFNDGVLPYTNPVDYLPANGYGLHDMAGNLFQWCWDWYGLYSSESQADPPGPTSGTQRVTRGGAWPNPAHGCRAAARYFSPVSNITPDSRHFDLGFRCVFPASQP